MALCLLMLALIGAADAATKDAALTLPYLIPVALAAWGLGPRAGVVLSVLSGGISYAGSRSELDTGVRLWNFGIDVGVFLAVVFLLTSLKTHLVGERLARLATEEVLATVNTLEALLPMCSSCKKVQDETDGSWAPFDVYLLNHTDTQVTHGMCPECMRKFYPDRRNKTGR
jgi:hypothetical protein